MECRMDGCAKPRHARGLCATHHKRWLRHGDPTIRAVPTITRFLLRIEVDENGCWIWTGATGGRGCYAKMWNGVTTEYAHRWSFEFFVGPIPDGMEIDHVWDAGCRSTLCVNPEHLEPVTHVRNVHRWLAHAVRS